MRLVSSILWLTVMVGGAKTMAMEIETPQFSAKFERGTLINLRDASGAVFVASETPIHGLGIRRLGADHWAQDDLQGERLQPGARASQEFRNFTDLPGASVRADYRVDAASGDLVLTQHATSPQEGVWGVEWSVVGIPLDMSILVPGYSGVKLTRGIPGSSYVFDYPMSWEAQLVIVEGAGRGFYVWAEDAELRFKRLTVTRTTNGWQLAFMTINYAPFERLTECASVTWRLNTYEGDWRVPARRYRDWMVAHLHPTPLAEQRPAWVKDIRCVVIMGMEVEIIESLAKRLDPQQTLLYIPSWRKAGYDRDYPTYDEPFEQWEPFVKRAHALGYRVMPHVNYFGVDPLNELYAQFEPYQCRSAWGDHEKLWWLWQRADPIIKFAYINPAYKPWRDLFVARMKELCERYEVDALHLDQTLCIFNDYNGLIDGLSMAQGNLALHRELREALPEVALSGEGLNEITSCYEAFAQRHVWGINHSEGTWSRKYLEAAHPISSYLLRPHTIIYGYLGCAPPTNGQLYAAWNEAYRHWGVIPTLKPDRQQIDNPTGFSRQFFDEVTFWQEERVDIDVDGDWPSHVAFPLRTVSGKQAGYLSDRSLAVEAQRITTTITGVTEFHGAGTIPGWRIYDGQRLFGLNPEAWYPYFPEPRDMDAFHVEALPEGFRVASVVVQDDMAIVRTEQVGGIVADLAEEIVNAICGSVHFEGETLEVKGPLHGEDGSGFHSEGSLLYAHPPWKTGTGVAYARYKVALPAEGQLRFVSEVYIDKGAVGQPNQDGVTFAIVVRGGNRETRRELHNATADPQELLLDLTPFAGQEVEVELSVHPGPNRSPSFDWARWARPRIERDIITQGEMVIGGRQRWSLALSGLETTAPHFVNDRLHVVCRFPGAVILLRDVQPAVIQLPLDIAGADWRMAFVSDEGELLDNPQYATAQRVAEQVVGGTPRAGLSIHPPDHGRTVVDLLVQLPAEPAEFHSYVGLRDGSKSDGVLFRVEANGVELAAERLVPGEWDKLTADLSLWAGKIVLLSLVTDAQGSFSYDWAAWGEPLIRVKGKE
ncbi:MAG: DUF6259 domain-containing protein [Candidatus Zipacnadales bacterium]